MKRHELLTRWSKQEDRARRAKELSDKPVPVSHGLYGKRYVFRDQLLGFLLSKGVKKFPVFNTEMELLSWMKDKAISLGYKYVDLKKNTFVAKGKKGPYDRSSDGRPSST